MTNLQGALNGQVIPPGTRGYVEMPVLTDLDGCEISLAVHAVVGSRAGPTLGVQAVLSPGEWMPAEVVRAVVGSLDAGSMSGTLLAMPVNDPIALASRSTIRDQSNRPAVERSFDHEQKGIADQLARAVETHVLHDVDAVIEIHSGGWGSATRGVTARRDSSDDGVRSRSFMMARAYGLPYIGVGYVTSPSPGTAPAPHLADATVGIPAISIDVGGAGFDPELERAWLEEAARGVRQVMQHLGMLPGKPVTPDEVTVFDGAYTVSVPNGGMLDPLFAPGELLRRAARPGETLGRIWSPYTLTVIEELRAPVRGPVGMVASARPVRPGELAFRCFDLDGAGTRCLHGSELP